MEPTLSQRYAAAGSRTWIHPSRGHIAALSEEGAFPISQSLADQMRQCNGKQDRTAWGQLGALCCQPFLL